MGLVNYVRQKTRFRILTGDTPYWIRSHKRGPYIQAVCVSAPPWVDRIDLVMLQEFARAMTKFTGEQHVLAHRVPLNHPRVCGLTVPWNIKIVHWRVNASENNYFEPDQLDLFSHEL